MVELDTKICDLYRGASFCLAKALNVSGSWRKLMAVIPVDLNNPTELRYNREHIRSIQSSSSSRHTCAEIFLEEWSHTLPYSPSLANLLELLKKAKVHIAADFITHFLINEQRTSSISGKTVSRRKILPHIYRYNVNTKISSIASEATHALTTILDKDDAWSKLIIVIPEGPLTSDVMKYDYGYISYFKKRATKEKRSCTDILFEDWLEDRMKLTLGFLIELLKRADLPVVLSYVYVFLLEGEDNHGPGATRDTSSSRWLPKMWQSLQGLFYDEC